MQSLRRSIRKAIQSGGCLNVVSEKEDVATSSCSEVHNMIDSVDSICSSAIQQHDADRKSLERDEVKVDTQRVVNKLILKVQRLEQELNNSKERMDDMSVRVAGLTCRMVRVEQDTGSLQHSISQCSSREMLDFSSKTSSRISEVESRLNEQQERITRLDLTQAGSGFVSV